MAVIHPRDCARDRRARFMRRMSFELSFLRQSYICTPALSTGQVDGIKFRSARLPRSPSSLTLLPPSFLSLFSLLIAFLLLSRFTSIECIFRSARTEDRRAGSPDPKISNSPVKSLKTGFWRYTKEIRNTGRDLLCDRVPIPFMARSTDRLY